MQAFSDKIYNWCTEIVSWEDGDNGITTKPTYQGYSAEGTLGSEQVLTNDEEPPSYEANGEPTGLRKRIGSFLK